MADIVSIKDRRPAPRSEGEARGRAARGAQILFFTGVRYERRDIAREREMTVQTPGMLLPAPGAHGPAPGGRL